MKKEDLGIKEALPAITCEGQNAPRVIYLQYHGDGEPDDECPVRDADVTWCRDKIFASDIEYVRAGRSTGRTRKPAEAWPVGHFVENEMRKRRWTKRELLSLMGGSPQRELEIELLLFAPTKGVILDSELAADLARVFGTSAGLWINLDKAWQDNDKTEL